MQTQTPTIYKVMGLMSGTSLDGLDLAYCHFWQINGHWHYNLLAAKTVEYTTTMRQALNSALQWSAWEYVRWHHVLGEFFGQECQKFIQENHLTVDFIASHGHTVFHQPTQGITAQIGNGADIAALTQLPVICDFRTLDVALGGQGAPLVPIGDAKLFHEYEVCINIGGIANFSVAYQGRRIAGDICPANMIFNELAQRIGLEFDKNGEQAALGENLWHKEKLYVALKNLQALPFYQQNFPKSLGKEWIWGVFVPALLAEIEVKQLENLTITQAQQLLCLATQHTAELIAETVRQITPPNSKILLTGGGAWNSYLVACLQKKLPTLQVIVPDKATVAFKEALIFAFLGVLRWQQEANCWQSVTGANRDNVGGAIYWGKKTN